MPLRFTKASFRPRRVHLGLGARAPPTRLGKRTPEVRDNQSPGRLLQPPYGSSPALVLSRTRRLGPSHNVDVFNQSFPRVF